MFLIPIRTEKDTVRVPYVTMGLIVLNLVIWLFTNRIVIQERHEVVELHMQLFEIEADYIQSLIRSDPDYLYHHGPVEVHQRFYKDVVRRSRQGDYDGWKTLYTEFESKMTGSFFHRWGFIPGKFSFLQLFLSIFLHMNFAHVFFNMLFLWIVGCNLEEDWGWWAFLFVYVFSGVAAGGLHALKFPQSNVPLIGASGAIAGIMGIFLVKYYKTKIRFFYIWLLRIWKPWGTFTAYAGLVIPFWVVQQIFGIKWSAESGVAYWTHIGGFLFGAVVAATLRLLGFDRAGMVEAGRPRATVPLARIDPAVSLVVQTREALWKDPQNVHLYFFYARAFLARNQERNAAVLYNLALPLIMKSSDSNLHMQIFRELSERDQLDILSERNLYWFANALEKMDRFAEAVKLYVRYANRFPNGRAREKALFRAAVLLRDGLKNEDQAQNAFAFFKIQYPGSKYLDPSVPSSGIKQSVISQ